MYVVCFPMMNLSLQDLGIPTEEASKVNLFHLMPGRSEAKHRGIDGTWFANGAEAGVFVDFDSEYSDILFFEQHQIIFWQVQWPVWIHLKFVHLMPLLTIWFWPTHCPKADHDGDGSVMPAWI